MIINGNESIRDMEEVAEWLLYHMSMEQRGALMAERPLLYARLFPGVSAEAILDVVSSGIQALPRRESLRPRHALAAQRDVS